MIRAVCKYTLFFYKNFSLIRISRLKFAKVEEYFKAGVNPNRSEI